MKTIKVFQGSYGSRIVTHNDHYRLLQGGMIYAAGPVQMCLDVAKAFGWAMKLQSGIVNRLNSDQISELAAASKRRALAKGEK